MRYARPNTEGSKLRYASRYGNVIGGEWIRPVEGEYFANRSPATGQPFCEIPRSTKEDIGLALDAAHAVQLANDPRCGLGAGVWTRNLLVSDDQKPMGFF
jgi:aldehyde dehydrogenase